MRTSIRIAYEELARKGWQDAAADAWSRWLHGQRYDPPPGIDRFTAALVAAANWDLEHGFATDSIGLRQAGPGPNR